jgi:hypothetical protein
MSITQWSCQTSGEVISAGGGRIARYFIGLTPGYFAGNLSAEDVRDHWDKVVDETGYIVPRDRPKRWR